MTSKYEIANSLISVISQLLAGLDIVRVESESGLSSVTNAIVVYKPFADEIEDGTGVDSPYFFTEDINYLQCLSNLGCLAEASVVDADGSFDFTLALESGEKLQARCLNDYGVDAGIHNGLVKSCFIVANTVYVISVTMSEEIDMFTFNFEVEASVDSVLGSYEDYFGKAAFYYYESIGVSLRNEVDGIAERAEANGLLHHQSQDWTSGITRLLYQTRKLELTYDEHV